MTANIILLVKDRPRLTEQTLRTLYETTAKSEFNLVVVDDHSGEETKEVLNRWWRAKESMLLVRPEYEESGCVGALKNTGARMVGDKRGSYLCFIDNDIAFMPGWLHAMTWSIDELTNESCEPAIMGGYRHPYHGVNEDIGVFQITDAVAGYMHFMTWDTWDKFGPYDANTKGVCQSEDHAICRRVVDAGGLVGYVEPPVIWNCGVTNSEGKPAIGSAMFPRVSGLIYE